MSHDGNSRSLQRFWHDEIYYKRKIVQLSIVSECYWWELMTYKWLNIKQFMVLPFLLVRGLQPPNHSSPPRLWIARKTVEYCLLSVEIWLEGTLFFAEFLLEFRSWMWATFISKMNSDWWKEHASSSTISLSLFLKYVAGNNTKNSYSVGLLRW